MRLMPLASRARIQPKRRCAAHPRRGPENRCWRSRSRRRLKLPNTMTAFDAMASTYDSKFTATRIGTMMRRAVWARCAARFAPGSRILEMNCGTGEDALWLAQRGVQVLATDVSPAMLRLAQDKLAASPSRVSATFRRLAWEELEAFDAGT